MNTLNLLLQQILEFLIYAKLGHFLALSIFFIFLFRIFFKRNDRVLFFIVLGTVLYLPIITHLLFAEYVPFGEYVLFGGDEIFIITMIGRISYVFQFFKYFPLAFVGGAIGFYLAELCLTNGYISELLKKSISAIIFISLFGSWLYLLIKHW